MSVFSNIGKNISNKGKEISRKAKVMSETSSLNNIIKGEECKIDTQYKLIGKMYFEKYNSSPEQEFEPAIDSIKNSMEKINETQQEILKIKSQFCCPECGTAFKNDAVFCSKCGAKLPEKPKQQSAATSQQKKCSNCGNTLNADAIFCYFCGTKFENNLSSLSDENTIVKPSEETEDNKNNQAVPIDSPKEASSINTDTDKTPSETIPQNSSLSDSKENTTVQQTFCPNCKNEMNEDDIFCNECGTKVK